MDILKKNYAQQEDIKSRTKTKLNDIFIKYRDLIESYRRKMSDELEKEEQKIKAIETKTLEAIETEMKDKNLIAIRNEHNKIMTLIYNFVTLTPNMESKAIEVNSCKYGDRTFYDPKGLIYTDKYTSLYWYIVNNKKPVNKYSLIIVGNTIFNDETLSLFKQSHLFDYGIDANTSNANIKIHIKDAPTEKILINHFSKHKNKTVSNITDPLKSIGKKYEEAIKLYKEKEWQIGYLEFRKYYYENHYCEGTSTPEYKKIISKLQTLKQQKNIR
jgi:hypothetical protein